MKMKLFKVTLYITTNSYFKGASRKSLETELRLNFAVMAKDKKEAIRKVGETRDLDLNNVIALKTSVEEEKLEVLSAIDLDCPVPKGATYAYSANDPFFDFYSE